MKPPIPPQYRPQTTNNPIDPHPPHSTSHANKDTNMLVDKEPQTHNELLDQIIRQTLKPIHATDPKVLMFIANYNMCKDVKQAAKLSGLTAWDGKNLIQRPDIYECVQKIAAAGARKFGYDAEEVVAKVKEVIEFDPADLVDPNTNSFYEDISLMPPEARRVIKKLTVQNIYDKDDNGIIIGVHSKILKFEFWDKLKAAELLGGEKDIFKKQVKIEHDVGVNMKETLLGRLEAAEERKALAAKDVGNSNRE